MEAIIRAEGLNKSYRMGEVTVEALKEASFELYEGEFVVMLGHSGSGKSTLLNIVGGMDSPSGGSLRYKDIPVHQMTNRQLTEYRRNTVGFVFQFFNLIPSLTARENVQLASDIAPNPLDIDEILGLVGLRERAGHFPSQMSGGEQQRVAIARAVVKNPDLLLCDEPTGALDLSTGLAVLELLKDYNKRYRKTVMIITHNTSIGQIADRVFTMRDGRLIGVEVNPNPLTPGEVTW